jgi:LysM repeat protein
VAASTVDDAISFWLSDDIHTNTMLSQYRSDIGAGVAVGGQIYVVIDTALQTRSGQQQSEAVDFLTGIPMTQAANSGGGTQSAGSLLPEYIIPVVRNTARPDGDVFHKVQFGQSLWSIAVTYGTTINRIRAWNNLGEETTIYQGQLLLVQKGATQPPPATSTPPPLPTMISTPTPTSSVVVPSFLTMTIQPVAAANAPAHQDSSSPNIWIVVLIVLFVVGGGVAALFIRTPN